LVPPTVIPVMAALHAASSTNVAVKGASTLAPDAEVMVGPAGAGPVAEILNVPRVELAVAP